MQSINYFSLEPIPSRFCEDEDIGEITNDDVDDISYKYGIPESFSYKEGPPRFIERKYFNLIGRLCSYAIYALECGNWIFLKSGSYSDRYNTDSVVLFWDGLTIRCVRSKSDGNNQDPSLASSSNWEISDNVMLPGIFEV